MPRSAAARRAAASAGWLALLAAPAAWPYGPEGHLIAGRAAEPMLCKQAAAEIERLGDGEDLGELGLWADRIRSDPGYADAAPWHYMNIADGESLLAFEHPPQGDVLWAIEHFSARLGEQDLDREARGEALRFLVHFVVDLHQPMHVGREEDRGGNEIELLFRGERTNLHRFWDSGAIALADETMAEYAARVGRLAAAIEVETNLDPVVWAQESLDLRPRVYDFGAAGRELPPRYEDFAALVSRERLALSARRLAGLLNRIFCG